MQDFNFQPAFILHARPYRETSLLLELFTRDFGRFGAIAKGVRRPKSKVRGLLQPFIPLLVSCSGRGELLTLKSFESNGAVPWLRGQPLVSAFYVNEITMRLLHRFDSHPDLFFHYQETLENLEKNTAEQETLRLFEKNLLKSLGYELQFDKEAETGESVYPDHDYLFDPEKGPILVKIQTGMVNASKHLFKGKSLLALAQGKFEGVTALLDAKKIMRLALSIHLGSKPLESRRLL